MYCPKTRISVAQGTSKLKFKKMARKYLLSAINFFGVRPDEEFIPASSGPR